MTAGERVRRTQRLLALVLGSSAICWGGAALLGLLVLGAALNASVTIPPHVQGMLPVGAAAGALATFGALVWRGRFAGSFDRVALWIEERAPELRYALVTAVDPRYAESVGRLMEPVIARVDTGSFVRNAATRSTLPALLALMMTAVVFTVVPEAWKDRMNTSALFPGGPTTPAVSGNRLVPLTGTLTPPAYAKLRTEELDEPTTIAGLLGSQVTLSGRGGPDGIRAMLAVPGALEKALPVTGGGRRWTLSFALTDSVGALLKLTDRHYDRLIVVDPRVDRPPEVKLAAPLRDTTLRVVSGTLTLSADLSDDVGLGTAHFEYIVSSGSEENFTFRQGTRGGRQLGGTTQGQLSVRVPYSDFNLQEGDYLSIRAVAYDENTLTGPGKGYSETRTIRVARQSEYDSVAITPAPPSADTALMSLRMLIIATEKLDERRSTMPNPQFVSETKTLARESARIRQKIQRVIDEQTGGGEIAASPLLVTALDAMWDATRYLYLAQTREALPPMYVAQRALMKLREEEKRYYLRGRLPAIVVNIERVRLTGTDTGTASPRTPRRADDSAKERLRRDYAGAIRVLRAAPDSAVALFTMMQVEALRPYPELASALGDAVAAIQSGTDATRPLLRARRVLEGSVVALDTFPVWSGAW